MKGVAARLRTFVAAGLLGVATIGGACSGGATPPDDGLLRVVLVVQEGYVVRSVRYEADSSSGTVIKRGEVGLPGAATGTSFQIALPPGEGDTILVTAVSTSGVPLRGTSKPFDIKPRWTTIVTVTLPGTSADAGAPPGKVDVNGTIAADARAPSIDFLLVSPLEVAADSAIDVSVTASDPEAGDSLAYAWTAVPDGLFASAFAPSTTYRSSTTGTKVLTITVSDRQVLALTASVSVAVTISSP